MAAPGDPSQLIGLFQSGLTKLAASFNVVTGAVEQFGSVLGKFVGLFNPAIVQQFTFATRDLLATIGQALAPVMAAAIPLVRQLADIIDGVRQRIAPLIDGGLNILKTVFGVLGQVVQQLAGQAMDLMLPVFKLLVEVFNQLMPVLVPILSIITRLAAMLLSIQAAVMQGILVPFRLILPLLGMLASLLSELMSPFLEIATTVGQLIGLFGQLAGELAGELGKLLTELIGVVIQPLISAFRFLVGVLRDVLAAVRAFFGLKDLGPVEKGDSRGKAVVSTGTTDVKSMLSKLQTSAFSLGGSDPARETARNTAPIGGVLGDIKQAINDLPKSIGEFVDRKFNELQQAVSDKIDAAARVLNPMNAVDILTTPFR